MASEWVRERMLRWGLRKRVKKMKRRVEMALVSVFNVSKWVKGRWSGSATSEGSCFLKFNLLFSILLNAEAPGNSIKPHAGRCSLFFHVALRFLPFNMNDWRESLMYIAAVLESKTRSKSIQSFLDFFSLTRSITFRCIHGIDVCMKYLYFINWNKKLKSWVWDTRDIIYVVRWFNRCLSSFNTSWLS